jgi:hypothetical protein
LELIKSRGVFLCPTLTFAVNIIDFGKECGSSQKQIDLRKREVEGLVRTYEMARKAGIPIMSGTESGFSMCPYGDWHGRELELLVDLCGLSPMAAITAATYTNARAIGADQDVGSLQPGRFADVLLLRENPLRRIGSLQDPSNFAAVFKEGREVERTAVAPRTRMGHESGFSVSTALLARDPTTNKAYAAQP